ncbi:2-hydroxychromene-2-carboxylate isomerase [Falsiroseomonas selenitidurans]|uniref:2-hydroxychromene-2-carboxylate isomerase n=1 Tax=Falsiroseomonas selenitidurans TaxID=2716335 RepID=A0ABX1ECZ6_9PROT|nr:2-hydroxychromene-2-carboxylate isomerase [Falsiroseomonas selenitidurans]NKC33638.1 2-hydroxychromene-2-carboxylate isomerase [Falsiroseomonas selenitidurans]
MHIDYYLSLNSPWTHLGAARIEALAARHGASIRPIPCDFGGTVFPASGGLPLPRRSPQRQAYRMQELRRWREALGLPIVLTPKHFPHDENRGAACVIAARETEGDAPALALAHAILKALWEAEANPADPATLAALIAGCGLDAKALLALAEDPRWLAQRQADSQAALERGVFGAPSYVIGEEIFWGQDRLDFVERRLAAG